ncbi:MAG: hypothetical protein ACFB0E_04995 [Leptolyngbyaceae cyanobacterium]
MFFEKSIEVLERINGEFVNDPMPEQESTLLFRSSYGVGGADYSVMSDAERWLSLDQYLPFQRIALTVFQARNVAAVSSLKKLLVALPSPLYAKKILLRALLQLLECELENGQWILDHCDCLLPELDLKATAQSIAIQHLTSLGFSSPHDFELSSEARLKISEPACTILLSALSDSDRIVIEKVLLDQDCRG